MRRAGFLDSVAQNFGMFDTTCIQLISFEGKIQLENILFSVKNCGLSENLTFIMHHIAISHASLIENSHNFFVPRFSH